MTILTTGVTAALHGLEQALHAPRRDGVALGTWRWTVRQRMAALRDALAGEDDAAEDGWLAARGGSAFRERNALLVRLARLGPAVLERPDAEGVRADLLRLAADVRRHVQRLHDLAYDEVEIELGGSE